MLGFDQSTCDLKLVEKKYRLSAKILHPDKNCHPEAKDYFDKLTKAKDDIIAKCSGKRFFWLNIKLLTLMY